MAVSLGVWIWTKAVRKWAWRWLLQCWLSVLFPSTRRRRKHHCFLIIARTWSCWAHGDDGKLVVVVSVHLIGCITFYGDLVFTLHAWYEMLQPLHSSSPLIKQALEYCSVCETDCKFASLADQRRIHAPGEWMSITHAGKFLLLGLWSVFIFSICLPHFNTHWYQQIPAALTLGDHLPHSHAPDADELGFGW